MKNYGDFVSYDSIAILKEGLKPKERYFVYHLMMVLKIFLKM